MAQAIVDLAREIVGRVKALRGGEILAVFGLEPRLEEGFELAPVAYDLGIARIVKRRRRRFCVAKHVDIRPIFPSLARLNG